MISLFTYRLPFKTPFRTANGTFTHREGLLIHMETDGFSSLVEAAPLPGFSPETADELLQALFGFKEKIDAFFSSDFGPDQLQSFLSSGPSIPSLQFALSAMGIDIMLQKHKVTPAKLFSKPPSNHLNVNRVLGSAPVDEMMRQIRQGMDLGFDTFKLKSIGNPAELITALEKIQIQFPQARFRIDANRSWPADMAPGYIRLFENLNIEYIEEPAKVGSVPEYRELIQNSNVLIALDESVSTVKRLNQALSLLPESVIILKPTLLGNIFDIYETISRYRSLLNDVVVTTALESAVGRTMVTSFAMFSGDPGRAHGLDTGRLFERDLHPGMPVRQGSISMNSPFKTLKFAEIDQNLIKKIV